MSKYNIDDITTTVYDEFFRVLDVLPYNKYRGLVGNVLQPIDSMCISIRDEDELKSVVGKARYPLYRVFDVKIEGVDSDI